MIGVTTSEVRVPEHVDPAPHADPPRREIALGLSYLHAIERAGGLPVILPPLSIEAVDPFLERLAGIVLSGGPDLDPIHYGEEPHPELGPIEPEVDCFELAVARHADARGLPVLAICRGAQALNIARGGTLHQHLPDVFDGRIEHRQTEAGDRPTHAVEVAPESLLARALGTERLEVNSFHHQAAERLGGGLRAVAWSPDGVIEGIEAPDRDFVVGVQWHAEGILALPEQAALFSAFIGAARRFPGRGARGRTG